VDSTGIPPYFSQAKESPMIWYCEIYHSIIYCQIIYVYVLYYLHSNYYLWPLHFSTQMLAQGLESHFVILYGSSCLIFPLCGVVIPISRIVIQSNCPPLIRALVEQCWEDVWQTVKYHLFLSLIYSLVISKMILDQD